METTRTTDSSWNSTINVTSGYEPSRKTAFAIVLLSIQSVILFMSIFGNVVTIITLAYIKRRRKKLSRMYLFILHLAIADLSVAILNVIPNICFIASFPNACFMTVNTSSCKMVAYLSVVVIYGSTYVLVATAVDRVIAICFPLKAQQLGDLHVHIMAGCAWILSFLFALPQLFVFEFNENDNTCETRWHMSEDKHLYYKRIYIAWFVAAVWVLPLGIITACYSGITCVIWNRGSAILAGTMSTGTGDGKRKSKARSRMMKPVQLTLAVVIGYILCWSPWMISMLVVNFNATVRAAEGIGHMVAFVLTYLIGLNSCINPFIYLCFNCGSLRRHTKRQKYTVATTQSNIGDTIPLSATCTSHLDTHVAETMKDETELGLLENKQTRGKSQT